MPTITFSVNLNQVDINSIPAPAAPTDPVSNLANTRSTFFPNYILDNRAAKHGDQFTVSGKDAVYLLNNFTSGENAFLTVVSNVF